MGKKSKKKKSKEASKSPQGSPDVAAVDVSAPSPPAEDVMAAAIEEPPALDPIPEETIPPGSTRDLSPDKPAESPVSASEVSPAGLT